MEQKILVTGGAGYIGSAVTEALVEKGYRVTVLDDFSTGQREKVPKNARVITGNIADYEMVAGVCSEHHFDAVMHFAAKKAVEESEGNPSFYYEGNLIGSFNLLRVMETHEIPQIIFSSTAAVYAPSATEMPVTEDMPLGPISVYGSSKFLVEELIKNYARTNRLKQYSILRYFNVAGDYGLDYKEEKAQNVFPLLAKSAKDDKGFNIFGTDCDTKDGTAVRDYIHLKDLVNAHLLALESKENDIYNLGTGTGYSVKELVAEFEKQLGRSIKTIEAPRRAGDPAVVVANADKAKAKLGWTPQHTLADMVADTLRVY